MDELNLYYSLLEAWGYSTMSNNLFLKKIEKIPWDRRYFADEEYYFGLGDFTLMTPTLDPFGEHKWSPSVITSEKSIFFFDGTEASLL